MAWEWPLWGERPEGGGTAALWGRRDPGGHTQGKGPTGLRVPVLFPVLFLSAEIPPARQEKGVRSWPGAHQDVPSGMVVPWALSAHSIQDGDLRSNNRASQRTWGSADLGTNPSISILSPESFPGCFLVDTPVTPAPYNVPETGASWECSRYSQLCISTL